MPQKVSPNCAFGTCSKPKHPQFNPFCSEEHKKAAAEERERRHLISAKSWYWGNSRNTLCAYCKNTLEEDDEGDYCKDCRSLGRDKRQGPYRAL